MSQTINTKTDDKLSQDSSPSTCDLAKLQIAQTIRDFHHKALWEEEKHFTWFISIILSADVLLLTTDKVQGIEKVILIDGMSLLGVLICLVALRVVKNESINF